MMNKTRTMVFLALLLTLLPGCKDRATPTVLPDPGAPEAQSLAETGYQVGIRSEFSVWDTTVTERLPLADREILVEPADELTFREDLTGTARMALAHPVSNLFQPDAFDHAEPVTWVLFLPESENPSVRSWQDIAIKALPNGTEQVLIIEREISQVIPFVPDETSTKASLQALFSERDNQANLESGSAFWIDALLMEETDEHGDKTWKLYAFGRPPGAPTGEEKNKTFCCRWLGCESATGRWAKICYYWDCLNVCKDS
jgi:hypothetical protein